MERKARRTVIDIAQHQSKINFEEAELSPPFTFPEYQKEILFSRFAAGAIDIAIVGRDALGSVARPGPLIVEEFDATVVVPPDATVHCDAIGCIVVEIAA